MGEEAASPQATPALPASDEAASRPAAAVEPSEATAARGGSSDPGPIQPTTDQTEGPALPPPSTRPLEDLLRLPAPIAEGYMGSDRVIEPGVPDPGEATEEGHRKRRIGVEIDQKQDPVGFDPNRPRAHSRTDAGVSVGVDERTRVRGGVRVEQEPERRREDPVPTIGIEQEF